MIVGVMVDALLAADAHVILALRVKIAVSERVLPVSTRSVVMSCVLVMVSVIHRRVVSVIADGPVSIARKRSVPTIASNKASAMEACVSVKLGLPESIVVRSPVPTIARV